MRKLIIFLLFLVFTVLAIGFFDGSFAMATNIVMIKEAEEAPAEENASLSMDEEDEESGKYADELSDEEKLIAVFADEDGQTTVINLPGLISKLVGLNCVVIGHSPEADVHAVFIIFASKIEGVPVSKLSAPSTNSISSAGLIMWLFTLLLIILLPKKRSKRFVRKIAEDVCDDQLQYSAPAPRRSKKAAKPAKRRRDYDEEDDDDYDDYE